MGKSCWKEFPRRRSRRGWVAPRRPGINKTTARPSPFLGPACLPAAISPLVHATLDVATHIPLPVALHRAAAKRAGSTRDTQARSPVAHAPTWSLSTSLRSTIIDAIVGIACVLYICAFSSLCLPFFRSFPVSSVSSRCGVTRRTDFSESLFLSMPRFFFFFSPLPVGIND